jgi:GST-like protein
MTIELHSWPTPNGRKILIMLEELELPYENVPIHIGKGEQHSPDFLKISPNNKIPAIIDPDGPGGEPVSIFESGAILIYLAEKHGRFIPTEPRERISMLEWLMFQMGGVGPMFGQSNHFRFIDDEVPYAIERYEKESYRLCGVIDRRIAEVPYLVGQDYTIADIATFPWVFGRRAQDIEFGNYPNLERWLDTIASRPAVERAMAITNN